MEWMYLKVSFPEGILFPEVNFILIILPWMVKFLAGIGALYKNYRIGYITYFANIAVYWICWALRDYYFKFLKPNPSIVETDRLVILLILDISKFGFPDAGLAYIVSVLLSYTILWGNAERKFVLIVTNGVLTCLLLYGYAHGHMLYFWQIALTFLFSVALTSIFMRVAGTIESFLESRFGDQSAKGELLY
jgi:hypothetical protein